MPEKIENINRHIASISALESPAQFLQRLPVSAAGNRVVTESRRQIADILKGVDERLLVITGPCSVHDTDAALEYADRLSRLKERVNDKLLLVMRAYFEKPRTTVGWKGIINDPDLNGSFNVEKGIDVARQFLVGLAERGLAAATEWLDPLTPQYLGDLISWGAIGARTTESQTHRQLASGLSSPVGFKNGTGGNRHSIQIAIDGVVAARTPHAFMGANSEGHIAVVVTAGNPNTHIVLRGGLSGTNFDSESVGEALDALAKANLEPYLMVDCSHGNSLKDHRRQPVVFRELLNQRAAGVKGIAGVMIESHLKEGRQDLSVNLEKLEYGVSITDACMGWETTEALILEAAERAL